MRQETRCCHIGNSFRLTASILLYAPSQRQDNTYLGLCYTSCGELAGTRNSSMGPPHEGSTRQPIAPWANALTTQSYISLLPMVGCHGLIPGAPINYTARAKQNKNSVTGHGLDLCTFWTSAIKIYPPSLTQSLKNFKEDRSFV